jgi:endoglucanase
MKLLNAFFVSLSLILSACGGSGSGGSKNSGGGNTSTNSSAVSVSAAMIRMNQVGFLRNSQKQAIVPNVAATQFSVLDATSNNAVLTSDLSAAATWAPAGETVKIADFSTITTPGNYRLVVDGVADQPIFTIADNIYNSLNDAALKTFYYQRASTALLDTHAGVYARSLGHPDNNVIVDVSAASPSRPTGTIISAQKGWYDAGDYNKYIVNSGISTYTLLAAFEKFSTYFSGRDLNIPESGNSAPDILDEIMWNLEWMQDMQDSDGGVYHKLTSQNFSGFVMPVADTSARYVVKKSTAATLDFAAVMAIASRVYANYSSQFPGKAAEFTTAAQSAYNWAVANPNVQFTNPTGFVTGEYGDTQLADEFFWARAELYISTQDDDYYKALNASAVTANVPYWGDVKTLGWISLAHNLKNLTNAADKDLIQARLDSLASNLVARKTNSAYGVTMETSDFDWGSNSTALNQAMILLEAYQLDKTKTDYLDVAQSQLDYVLGRNPTGYSFVTVYGSKTPQNIHHRPSGADGIAAPIPGFLAGGPNPGQQDKSNCPAYPSAPIALSYLDNLCSYASNEIAINWNAVLVYVGAAIQVLGTE